VKVVESAASVLDESSFFGNHQEDDGTQFNLNGDDSGQSPTHEGDKKGSKDEVVDEKTL
jgi:hypothetical protein